MTTEMTWTSSTGRTYRVKRDESTPELNRKHIESQGFDGWNYDAESTPVGRQKKTKYAILYRTKSGQFSFVYGF